MADTAIVTLRDGTRTEDFAVGFAWQNNKKAMSIGPGGISQVTAGPALGILPRKSTKAYSLFKSIWATCDVELLKSTVLAIWQDGEVVYAHEITEIGPALDQEQILKSEDEVKEVLKNTRARVLLCNASIYSFAQDHFRGQIHVLQEEIVIAAADGLLIPRHRLSFGQLTIFGGAALIAITAVSGWSYLSQTEPEVVVEATPIITSFETQDTGGFVQACENIVGYAGPRIYGKSLIEIGCHSNGRATALSKEGAIAWQRSAQDTNRNATISDRLWSELENSWKHEAVSVESDVYTGVILDVAPAQMEQKPDIARVNLIEYTRSLFFGKINSVEEAGDTRLTLTLKTNINDALARLKDAKDIDVVSVSENLGTQLTTLTLAQKRIIER